MSNHHKRVSMFLEERRVLYAIRLSSNEVL